jgi:hypothetical protein
MAAIRIHALATLYVAVAGCRSGDSAAFVRPTETAEADATEVAARPCRAIVDEYLFSLDGSESAHHTYATDYDAEGRPTVAETDFNTDVVVDERATSTWRDGLLVVVDTDLDDDTDDTVPGVDGTTNQSARYSYDDEGRLKTIGFDVGPDGVDDAVHSLTWSDDGELQSYAYDNDGDGSVDEIDRFTYTASGDTNTWLFDGVGTNDWLATYTYVAPGRVGSVVFAEGEGFGDVIGTHTWSWDEASMLTRIDIDWSGFGIPLEQRLDYTWDALGDILQVDVSTDATLNTTYRYSGDCTFGAELLVPSLSQSDSAGGAYRPAYSSGSSTERRKASIAASSSSTSGLTPAWASSSSASAGGAYNPS